MQQDEEQLSAFVDDELDAPAGALLTRLIEDRENRERWVRYHLIGDVLRDRDVPLATDLRARIADALAKEPALLVPPVKSPVRTVAPRALAGRWALAAGLAAVAVFGASFVAREPVQPDVSVAGWPTAAPVRQPPGSAAQRQVVSWDEAGTASVANPQTVEFHRRLNSYLVNFNEQRADLGVPGVHPYVRIVGFEAEPEP